MLFDCLGGGEAREAKVCEKTGPVTGIKSCGSGKEATGFSKVADGKRDN